MHATKLKLKLAKLKSKHIGKLFSVEDMRGFEMFGLILDVFTDSECYLYKVLSEGEVWEIDLTEYKIKFYD